MGMPAFTRLQKASRKKILSDRARFSFSAENPFDITNSDFFASPASVFGEKPTGFPTGVSKVGISVSGMSREEGSKVRFFRI